LLVEAQALDQTEQEYLADSKARARRREREARRREELDQQYVEQFAVRVSELFPGSRPERAIVIAEHTSQKYSGRVGRSAAAKQLDVSAVRLAIIAHIRHVETQYDSLLANGYERHKARALVQAEVNQVLDRGLRRE